MNTKDKLNLLYWSADPSASTKTNIQPTFATSTLRFSDVHAEYVTRDNVDFSCNFDLIDPSTIMLHLSSDQHHTDTEEEEEEDGKHGSYLTLKPIEYYVDYHFRWTRAHVGDTLCKTQDFYQQFDIVPEDVNDDPRPGLDFVRIPAFSYQAIEATPHLVWDFHTLCLIGSFKHNKWLVTDAYRYERIDSDFGWIHNGRHKAANDYTSFHIY
ncbi:hypothetical protein BCR42DRAFT_443159 [Absidia repens]|uniref:Uncharacterized protein n=1 Tax=Absidia repens TaxID=90262 RepID=A0A1X2I090_9FUNG|nr:hypothetical protein BCR42DRAFT_443159 [Absidia repens]